MKAAVIRGPGETPVFADFEEPVAQAGQLRIAVTAAAISPLAKGRAAGTHYSAANLFPFVPGVDGTGRTDDGRRVYFLSPRAPFGSMAEETVVDAAYCTALPDDLDDVTAAALANPGMSSWVGFAQRAKLQAGETVLVNGATGTAGRLAVQIAKHMGAKKIVATGRNAEVLRTLTGLGADATVPLVEDGTVLEESFKEHFAQGIDVVIDYLWGKSAEALLRAAAKAAPDARPIRYVEVGGSSGPDIVLPGAVLRSKAIVLMGSGLGSVSMERLVAGIGELLATARTAGFEVAFVPVPLSQVESAWSRNESTRRTVFLCRN